MKTDVEKMFAHLSFVEWLIREVEDDPVKYFEFDLDEVKKLRISILKKIEESLKKIYN